MKLPLSGRTAVVTGAAGGLGRAILERLAADGATVAGLDLKLGGSNDPRGPGVVHWIECDVTDERSVHRAVKQFAAQSDGVDILVNNAGLLSGRESFDKSDSEQMHRYFDVNAVGSLHMVKACLPYLKNSSHQGRIINICSRTFFTGGAGQLAYVASKGALLGMTRVMANELGPDRITVNAAIPAQVATPGTRQHSGDEAFTKTMQKQAIQQFVTPEDFAGLVAFLASPDARMITGQTIVCDGGGLLH